jgi:hypothetical protein
LYVANLFADHGATEEAMLFLALLLVLAAACIVSLLLTLVTSDVLVTVASGSSRSRTLGALTATINSFVALLAIFPAIALGPFLSFEFSFLLLTVKGFFFLHVFFNELFPVRHHTLLHHDHCQGLDSFLFGRAVTLVLFLRE